MVELMPTWNSLRLVLEKHFLQTHTQICVRMCKLFIFQISKFWCQGEGKGEIFKILN